MSEPVNYDALMRVYPSVLKRSQTTDGLGKATAKQLYLVYGDLWLADIYGRIDQLPEELLDILAKDFDISWYDYNYDLETKRRVIKDSFYVQRYKGTTGAVRKALSSVWPHTTVEEWFEYGGNPYYFRVLIEANSDFPIYINDSLRMLYWYKSIRSHLEDGMPIIRVTFGIVIKTESFNHKYHPDSCGTKPRWATHGDKSHEDLIIETQGLSAKYLPPKTGELIAGTYPRVSTHGDVEDDGLHVGTDTLEATYKPRPCGTSLNSLM